MVALPGNLGAPVVDEVSLDTDDRLVSVDSPHDSPVRVTLDHG